MFIEFLIIAVLAPTIWTKLVQDGRSDREYARQGMVSPRYQERLAKLEAAGRPKQGKPRAAGRGPLRSYLSELYADAMLDRVELHRAKRAHRGPVRYDPDRPSVAQRFDAAVLDGIRRVQESRGWDVTKAAAKTAGRRLVEPVGEKPAEELPVPDAAPADDSGPDWSAIKYESGVHYTPPKIGERYDDMEWTGDVWTPVCPRCDKPMGGHDARGWLICDRCGLRAADRHNPQPDNRIHDVNLARTVAVYEDEGRNIAAREAEQRQDDTNPTNIPTPTTGGTVMTEASNFETAVPALGELQSACQNLSDHVAGAEAAADTFQAHVEEIDAAKQDVTAAIGSVQEQLAAKGVSGAAMDSVQAAMEQVQAGDLMSAIDLIGQAKAQITDAKVAAAEASGAAGQAQQDLIGQFGDAHNTIASDLGGDASFLDSGGGAGAGAGSAGASGGGGTVNTGGMTNVGEAVGPGARVVTGGGAPPPPPRAASRSGGSSGPSVVNHGPMTNVGSAIGDGVTVNNG